MTRPAGCVHRRSFRRRQRRLEVADYLERYPQTKHFLPERYQRHYARQASLGGEHWKKNCSGIDDEFASAKRFMMDRLGAPTF
jgi:hypothetical protein